MLHLHELTNAIQADREREIRERLPRRVASRRAAGTPRSRTPGSSWRACAGPSCGASLGRRSASDRRQPGPVPASGVVALVA